MYSRSVGRAGAGRSSTASWVGEKHARRQYRSAKRRSKSSGQVDYYGRLKAKMAQFRQYHPGIAPKGRIKPSQLGFDWRASVGEIELLIMITPLVKLEISGNPELVGQFCREHGINLDEPGVKDYTGMGPQPGEMIRTVSCEPMIGSTALSSISSKAQELSH